LRIIRQVSADGFAVTEVMIVLFLIVLIFPVKMMKEPQITMDIENQIILRQLEAMANRKTVLLDEEICQSQNCWFNPRGNINKPAIIRLTKKGVPYELVIWLGFGRFKVSKGISDD
jgi:hypothetical protein